MTQYPEIALARELGMCYVNISVVTDYDAGLEGEHGIAPVSMVTALEVFKRNTALVRDAISHAVRAAPDGRTCRCAEYANGRLICRRWEIEYVSNGHYLEAIADFYDDVARQPEVGLCCVGGNKLSLVDLCVPPEMEAMDYGCGSSVSPRALSGSPRALYVGVGGGKEALQFAYFSRVRGGVVAIEPVEAMREAATRNLLAAAACNSWFDPAFVDIRPGDAFRWASTMHPSTSSHKTAFLMSSSLRTSHARCTKRDVSCVQVDRLSMSDPIATRAIPEELASDPRLRAMCLGGALTYTAYLDRLIAAGFGQIEIRRKRPDRVLDRATYKLDSALVLKSIDLVAINVPIPSDGACIFSGRTMSYVGPEPRFDDGAGHVLERGLPIDVCDKTAKLLASKSDLVATASTFHYDGAGTC